MSTMGHVQLCLRCTSEAEHIQAHIRLRAEVAAVDLILNGSTSVQTGIDQRVDFRVEKA